MQHIQIILVTKFQLKQTVIYWTKFAQKRVFFGPHKCKACVRCFSLFHQKKAFQNYEKYVLFHLKSSCRSEDIQFFVIFAFQM